MGLKFGRISPRPLLAKLTPFYSCNQGDGWSRAMSRYSEAVKADARRRMSPPMRQRGHYLPWQAPMLEGIRLN